MSLRPAKRVEALQRTLIRRIFDSAPPDAINLGLGQPDLPTPDGVRLAGVAAVASGDTGYTATAGAPELRAAVARRYAPFASGPDDVLVTVGSQEAMFTAFFSLVNEGDEVLCPDPGYPAYPELARLVGAIPVPYELEAGHGFRLRASDIERRLNPRTGLVVLCSPANPTGACHSAHELQTLVEMLEDADVPWLSDEVYSGFVYEGARAPSPTQFSREGGVVVSGLSKDMSMTGWRVGWLVGPGVLIERAVALHQYLVTCAAAPSQRAALAAFSSQGESERLGLLERFRNRRALMARELDVIDGIRFDLPQGAFYFFVDVSRFGGSQVVARRILERGNVITIPGVAFGAAGEGYLRVSFAASEEDISAGVRRMAEELRG